MITNDFYNLTWKEVANNSAMINITDLSSNFSDTLEFSLKYYNPANGTDNYNNTDNCASGAYIFKPMQNDTKTRDYSKFGSVQVLKGKNVQEFVINYSNANQTEAFQSVIRLVKDSPVIQ